MSIDMKNKQKEKEMYRHGEIIITKTDSIKGKKLSHLILAEGEVTGHKHEVIGDAELYEDKDGTLYLRVNNEAEVVHEEHNPITLPMGDYKVRKQREYVVGDEKYRNVVD